MVAKEPWSPADATSAIREIARHGKFKITLTGHARDRMVERDLTMGDLLYVLKNGFVYAPQNKPHNRICGNIQSKQGRPTREIGLCD